MPDIKVDVTIIGQTRDEVGVAYDATIDWAAGTWTLAETILPGIEASNYNGGLYASLENAEQVQVRPSDNMIYVADYTNSACKRISATGQTLSATISSLTECSGVCLDASNNVYVVYRPTIGQYAIRKYSSAHSVLWTTPNIPAANKPIHICTDGTHVFATTADHKIARYLCSTGAEVLPRWGSLGTGNGQFNTPWGICQDGTHLFVVDRGNKRMQKLAKIDGTYAAQWAVGDGPRGCNLDTSGNVMIVDDVNKDFRRYTKFGVLVDTTRTEWFQRGIAMNSTGVIWISQNWGGQLGGDPEDTYLGKWTLDVNGLWRKPFTIGDPTSIMPDWEKGILYISDYDIQRCTVITSDGNYVYSTYGDGYDNPLDLALHPTNKHWYQCGYDNSNFWFYIVEYDNRLWLDDGWMDPAGGTYWNQGITVNDSAGWMTTIYDDGTTHESYLEEFALSHLTHTGDWIPQNMPEVGSAPGQFFDPYGVTSDEEYIYVGDSGNHRVQKFAWHSDTPPFILQWSAPGVKVITMDPTGNILHCNVDDGTVYITNPDGATVETFQSLPGIDCAAMDEKGQIWVGNSDNPRVERWIKLESPLPPGAQDPDGMEFLVETRAGMTTEQIRDEIRDAAIARLNQEPGFAAAGLTRANVRVDGFTNTGTDDLTGPVPLTWYSGAALTPTIPGTAHTPTYISPVQVLKTFNVALNDDLKDDLMAPIIYLDQVPDQIYFPEHFQYFLQGWNGTAEVWRTPLFLTNNGFVLTARIDLQEPEQTPLWNTGNVWLRLVIVRTTTGVSIPATASGRITSAIINFQKV